MASKTDNTAGAAPKRKRVRVKTGQLVAVPLQDGTFALLHVALYNGMVIGAHFAHRAGRPELLLDGLEEAMSNRLIAMLEVTSDEIYDGCWPVIGQKEPSYPSELLDMKGVSYTASMSRGFFSAYYGLTPWDRMADPRYYEGLLLPGVPVPPTVRYKRDFEQEAPVTRQNVPAQTDAEPTVTEGPGEVHIEIKYPGEELPTIELLKRRESIEHALESAGVGEVTNAGGGGGVMDIYLETQDVARALPAARAAIQEAGFEGASRIEVKPLDTESDTDDPEDPTAEDEVS